MRYLVFIKHTRDYVDTEAPPELYQAMGAFVEEQIGKGVFIDVGGLKPLANSTRVRLADGRISVSEGPFPASGDVVGGYALIETPARADAVALAREFMEIHRLHWPAFEGESELRPLEGPGC